MIKFAHFMLSFMCFCFWLAMMHDISSLAENTVSEIIWLTVALIASGTLINIKGEIAKMREYIENSNK